MDAEFPIQQIFATSAVRCARPRAIRPPARNGLPNFRARPWNQARVITQPRCEPRAIVKIQSQRSRARKIVHRLGHCIAAVFECCIRCRARRAYDDVCARLFRQFLNYRSEYAVRAHLLENRPARHVGLFYLKPGCSLWDEAFDSSACWERDTNVQSAIRGSLTPTPSYIRGR